MVSSHVVASCGNAGKLAAGVRRALELLEFRSRALPVSWGLWRSRTLGRT